MLSFIAVALLAVYDGQLAMRWSLFRQLKQRPLFLVVICLSSGLCAMKIGHLKIGCRSFPGGQVVDHLVLLVCVVNVAVGCHCFWELVCFSYWFQPVVEGDQIWSVDAAVDDVLLPSYKI